MAFSKVPQQKINEAGVKPLPDSPTLQPAQLKAKFDEKGDMALEAFNKHIDEISEQTGCGNIGARVPSGLVCNSNVQGIIDAIWLIIKANADDRHTHINKTVLDSITEDQKMDYDRLSIMLKDIVHVKNTITVSGASDEDIPTTSAVANFIANYNYHTILLDAFYPVGTVYYDTNAINPSGMFGGSWRKISQNGAVSGWERTA